MRLYALIKEYDDGTRDCDQAIGQARMDASSEDWAGIIEAAKAEVAGTATEGSNGYYAVAFGVVVLDIPDELIEAAFKRGSDARTEGRTDG